MKAVLRKLREGKRERGCTPTLKFKDETITEAEVWQHFRKKRPKGSSLADVPTPTRSRAPTPPGLLESEAVSFPSGPSLGGSPNDESSISSYSPCVVTESSSQTYQKDGADTLTSPQRSESGNNVIQRRTLFSITGLQLQAITRPMSFKIRDVKFESTMMLTPFKIRDGKFKSTLMLTSNPSANRLLHRYGKSSMQLSQGWHLVPKWFDCFDLLFFRQGFLHVLH